MISNNLCVVLRGYGVSKGDNRALSQGGLEQRSAGQRGSGAEVHLCFSTVRKNWIGLSVPYTLAMNWFS